MNVNLAKQLLNRKGVYLTEEGKRRLEELIRDYKQTIRIVPANSDISQVKSCLLTLI